MVQIKLELLEGARAPERDVGDAGWDCYINKFYDYDDGKLVETKYKGVNMKHGNMVIAGLGFKTEIPKGYYAKVVSRSGLAIKHGIFITNGPGTIDSGYRGEWVAIISKGYKNDDNYDDFEVGHILSKGDKICQFIIQEEVPTTIKIVSSLSKSKRGANGFGSTGN